ncbi:MAG: DUF503 domain-containing protein [Myxococcota bacterium]|jgi:uncharacterized protein YlxP (DUF503 family)|nr:DUF503 domain-containing protein [Myxococcota bacterium]
MQVGVCEVTLGLPGNRSLKDKRHVVRAVIDRVTRRFRTNIAEVDCQDDHDRVVLGYAVVGNDPALIDARLREILEFIDDLCLAVLTEHQHEVIEW